MNRSLLKTLAEGFAVAIGAGFFMVASIAGAPNGSGNGGMEGTVPTDVFSVVLPTFPGTPIPPNTPRSDVFNFILDPFQLAKDSHPDKSFEPNATLFFRNALGSPYDYSHTSDSLTIQNKGTVNVDIKLSVTLTGMDNIILTNDSAFNNDRNTSVYLALTDTNKKSSVIDKYGAFLRKTLNGKPDAYKFIFDSTSGKYKYVLKNDNELQAGNIKFEDYSFQLTGSCNSSGSWTKVVTPADAGITVIWKVSPRPVNLAPSIGKTSYIISRNIANTIDVDLGSGNLAATGIPSITYKNSFGNAITLGTDKYTFTGDTLTFNALYITSLINAGVTSRTHTIVFNDKAATKVPVTLAVNDIAPSIEQTSYEMTKDQPVLINMNLGSGTLGATKIASITFTNASGISKTLGIDQYSFADGILTISDAYVNALIANSVTSRIFTITLNDKASTKWPVTLSVSGTIPAIGMTSSTMRKKEAVSVDIDWGSGTLAATDIKSITFKNRSGVIKTLPADQYSISNGILTFNASYITDLINAGIISYTYTITFNNISNTTAAITLTAEDIAPTIGQTSYTMHNGKPVSVSMDLGSGNPGATGIASITFTNRRGILKTLETDQYTLVDGVLTFNAAYIDSLIKGGVATRVHTVTLNNKEATKWQVTLSVNGTFPSVNVKDYSIRRDQAVPVQINFGSGDLEASDIKSIIFTNASGVTKTLGADTYTLTNSILTFSPSYINGLIDNGIVSRTYTIIFDNISETQVPVTFTAIDVAPSIAGVSYKMTYGHPTFVTLDLGAGNTKATGIKSITFINARGVLKTLTANDYTLSDNKTLKFKVALINGLIDGNIASRTFTVAFNNKSETKATVVLTQ